MIDTRSLEEVDPQTAALIRRDVVRQNSHIQLIASENIASPAVLAASGSVFTNKYAEGLPGKRYYEGCQVVDEIEDLARDRITALVGAEYANVQPHSGAQANMAVYHALLEPGDTVLGLRLDHGGHLTHGSPVNFSGKHYRFVAYGVDPTTEQIDLEELRRLALEHRPKVLLGGYTAYSRVIDWAAMRAIADEVGAIFWVDAAHFFGLVAGKAYPSPVPHADVVTATTHKSLRGPRGGLVLAKEEFGARLDKGVFPDVQGGAIFSQIAAKAVCFQEAAQPDFETYAHQVVRNAQAMAATFSEQGLRVVSGGTDNHLMLVDLRAIDPELTGRDAARLLDGVGLTCNFNTVPDDPRPPFRASGLRIGTPAMTSQGLAEEQAIEVATHLVTALREREDEGALEKVRTAVAELADAFPSYPKDFSGHA